MVDVRSLRTDASSAASAGAARSAVTRQAAVRGFVCLLTSSTSHHARELDTIREDAPDRVARRREITGQRRIVALEQREHLEHQPVIALTQLGQGEAAVPLVERLEL